ncbi:MULTISPECIES: hypothetical protein [unclassified Lysobacter]|uniref:hypothetical protein n=1 Tax=unclassified Lysobacter TaxID=2635362 RepID=UPI001BEA4F50|nr:MULTISPECIES: hypothetical protein [unclassified Lysobacter]MBT2746103.1 hypothetical protein [Lysobacter sp. ISL-42]MBT2752538.1 hypothetical protein [Lysobacter sp. ISL-50]MBT2776733.1 hypothetical protein [Lysobacter sp. ISL-54]MBT2780699.1 hypothetical protein [Lysobacter sp. ISL-52]
MLFFPMRIKNSRAAFVLHLFDWQVLSDRVCGTAFQFRDRGHLGNARCGESGHGNGAVAMRRVMVLPDRAGFAVVWRKAGPAGAALTARWTGLGLAPVP